MLLNFLQINQLKIIKHFFNGINYIVKENYINSKSFSSNLFSIKKVFII